MRVVIFTTSCDFLGGRAGVSVTVYRCAGDHRRPTTENHRPLLTSASSFLTLRLACADMQYINASRHRSTNALEHGALERECAVALSSGPQRCTQNNAESAGSGTTTGTSAPIFSLARCEYREGHCFRTSRASSFLAVAFVGNPHCQEHTQTLPPHSQRSR